MYDGVFEVEPQVQAMVDAKGKEVRWGGIGSPGCMGRGGTAVWEFEFVCQG